MKKILLLLSVVFISASLHSQTLRMTTVSINEQKVVKHRQNNHIIIGGGFTAYYNQYYDDGPTFIMLGYYKTDLYLNGKLGLYFNGTTGFSTATGGTIGVTYHLMDFSSSTLFLIGGGGIAYYEENKTDRYKYEEEFYLPRVEAGVLYNFHKLDLRATIGYPDYLTLGVGFKF